MKRWQISLRLMFLCVALFAVIFAWLGERRHLEQFELRRKLDLLEYCRTDFVNGPVDPKNNLCLRENLAWLESEIERTREKLGEPAPKK
jgi:hypothetical protein